VTAPSRIEYEIGQTKYGQRLVLIHEPNGSYGPWSLRKEASSQRDETQTIIGLSAANLQAIGDVVTRGST
jgi:hypothetical protein